MQPAAQSKSDPADKSDPANNPDPDPADAPLRLLLIRTTKGELPWMAENIVRYMAPVELVQVIGVATGLWRLGNERFDSVLLDLEVNDPAAMKYCREQIANVAAVPVLDLREQIEPKPTETAPPRGKNDREPNRDRSASRKTARMPWERRPKRQATPRV